MTDHSGRWAVVVRRVAEVAALRAVASSAGIDVEPLWTAAEELGRAAGGMSAPGTVRELRACGELADRMAGELGPRLGDLHSRVVVERDGLRIRCETLDEVSRTTSWPAPVSARVRSGLLASAEAAAGRARNTGLSGVALLDGRALGTARPDSLRARIARLLGRDQMRSYRSHERAAAAIRAFVPPARPQLLAADRRYRDDLAAGVQAADAALAGHQAELLAAHRNLERVVAGLSAPVAVAMPSGPPGGVDELHLRLADVVVGFSGGVQRLGTGTSRWFWLTAPDSVRRDLLTVFGRWGYYVSRAAVVRSLRYAWQARVQRADGAVRAAVNAAFTSELGRRLSELDGLPALWKAELDTQSTRVRDRLDVAERLLAALEAAGDSLAEALAGWRELYRPGDGGLSPVTRAGLAELSEAAIGVDGADRLRRDLADLAAGMAEVRIAVVGSRKVGTSTLVGALLGADLAPGGAEPMTMLATRFAAIAADGGDRCPVLRVPADVAGDYRRVAERIAREIGSAGLDGDAERFGPWSAELVAELGRRPELPGDGSLGSDGAAGPPGVVQYTDAEAIRTVLTRLNRTARLAAAIPADGAAGGDPRGDWTVEVEVPVTALAGPGRLVLIDTPNPGSGDCGAVLDEAHGCIVVVDFTQVGSIDADRLSRFVAAHGDGFGAGDAVLSAVAVNRVDQRNAGADQGRGPEQTARIGRRASGLPAGSDPLIFETSARRGLAAQRVAGGDVSAVRDLVREIYPIRPPDPAGLTAELIEELVEEARSSAGTDALRAALFGRVGVDLPRLAAEHALRRVTALKTEGDRIAADALASLVDDVRWALARAADDPQPSKAA